MSYVLPLIARAGLVRAASVEQSKNRMTKVKALRASFIEGPTELAPVSELAPQPTENLVGLYRAVHFPQNLDFQVFSPRRWSVFFVGSLCACCLDVGPTVLWEILHRNVQFPVFVVSCVCSGLYSADF